MILSKKIGEALSGCPLPETQESRSLYAAIPPTTESPDDSFLAFLNAAKAAANSNNLSYVKQMFEAFCSAGEKKCIDQSIPTKLSEYVAGKPRDQDFTTDVQGLITARGDATWDSFIGRCNAQAPGPEENNNWWVAVVCAVGVCAAVISAYKYRRSEPLRRCIRGREYTAIPGA